MRSKLRALRIVSGKLPEAMVDDARRRIEASLAQSQIPYVRSGILNSTLNIYNELGLYQQAYDLIKTELPRAQSPYYLKADLATFSEKLGRADEALKLSDEAYRESRGAATRFQWGQSYVAALIRLSPQDETRIQQAAQQVLSELSGHDRIYRRARLRLETLDQDLRAWNTAADGQHARVLKSLHTHMQTICVNIPNEEAAFASCNKFLNGT